MAPAPGQPAGCQISTERPDEGRGSLASGTKDEAWLRGGRAPARPTDVAPPGPRKLPHWALRPLPVTTHRKEIPMISRRCSFAASVTAGWACILGLAGPSFPRDKAPGFPPGDRTAEAAAGKNELLPGARPLRIDGDNAGISRASVEGPRFHAPDLLQGVEDYHDPRLRRLREEYQLDQVIGEETSEFRRILKLRRWVHSRWPIDNSQNFTGDAFAILEKATTGAGFNCSHSMAVQQAVLSSMGYVARNVLADRNHEEIGRSLHHGVNEVWSNDFAKWVLVDAKYDIHFERDGIPLSALQLHEAVRADGGHGILMVRGVERRAVPMDEARPPAQITEATIRNYWWVCYPQRRSQFTQPDFTVRERHVIFDNEAFRRTVWHRGDATALVRHWAYAARAFIPTTDRHQIEWTPGVPDLRLRRTTPAELDVEIRSATPNLDAYVIRQNDGEPLAATGGRRRWKLAPGENRLEVRARNLFGVMGPPVTAVVLFQP